MLKTISLYTGVGGLDLGFEASNFDTAVAVEMNPEAVATLRANRNWPVIDRDIHSITSKQLLEIGGMGNAEADVLIGGPPCQPFSKSGYWASGDTLRLDDPRAGTIGAYLRVLRDTLPRAFLLENVPGLAYAGKREGLDFIERTINRINLERGTNYQPHIARLNSADYGVPQLRERVFVIGGRAGQPFSVPKATHRPRTEESQEEISVLPYYSTAWDAIGDLDLDDTGPELGMRGKWAELLPSIPEGENYLWHTERGGGLPLFGWRRRYWSFLLKLAKTRPSWTIQAQPGPAIGPFHWNSRRLSVRELCRIQTIPDTYTILGGLTAAQRQLGNAVPSALAEVLARAIRRQIFGENVDETLTLIPQSRTPVPRPEPIAAVPKKYHQLVGEHEAHPGTGKGRAAVYRRNKTRKKVREVGSSLPLLPSASA